MLSFTEKQLSFLKSDRPIRVEIKSTDGEIVLTGEDILEGTLVIDKNCSSSSSFELGNTESSELTFSIFDWKNKYEHVVFEGKTLVVTLLLGEEKMVLGTFTVDEKPMEGKKRTVRALDNMARFDIPYHFRRFTFPTTLRGFILQMASQAGVQVDLPSLCNDDYLLKEAPVMEERNATSLHQMLSYAMALQGANAYMDALGVLRARDKVHFVKEIDVSIFPLKSLRHAEQDVSITGITFTQKTKKENETGYDEKTYLYGEDGYTLSLTGNPLLTHEIEQVLQNIGEKWNGTTWRPFQDFILYPIPFLEPMDMIRYEGKNFLITHLNLKVEGSLKLKGVGETKRKKGYATPSGFTETQNSIIEAIAIEKAEVIERAIRNGYLEAIDDLNRSVTQALGFYQTTVTDPMTGAKIVYTHDKPRIEESKYIEFKDSGQLVWTNDGWNNGKPTWKYGYTKEGSLVMRLISTVGLNAEWIRLEGLPLKTYLERKQQENITQINNLGATVIQNTTVDGVPVANKVAELTAEFLTFKRNTGAQDGTNLLLNPTMGTPAAVDKLYWLDMMLTPTFWKDYEAMGYSWEDWEQYTWNDLYKWEGDSPLKEIDTWREYRRMLYTWHDWSKYKWEDVLRGIV